MKNRRKRRASGFSLIELVIVVVIIGIIAAIAIPRLSRGAAGASDSSVSADLAELRNAVDVFSAEHGGTFPVGATFLTQMTTYSDTTGATATTKDATHIYGPYLRAIPPLPVGANKGGTGVAATSAAGVGWIYVDATGVVTANTTTEADATGKLYSAY